jgi:hypothetical protein
MRRTTLLLTAIPLILASFVAAPHSALANNTTCPQEPSSATCDGVSPGKTYCTDQDEVVKETLFSSYEGNPLGYIKLWWSATCGTEWAQGVSYYAKGAVPFIQVVRDTDDNFYSCNTTYVSSYGGYECSTEMVYTGVNTGHAYETNIWDPYDGIWLSESTKSG